MKKRLFTETGRHHDKQRHPTGQAHQTDPQAPPEPAVPSGCGPGIFMVPPATVQVQTDDRFRIALAAPTGKAAQRLRESLAGRLDDFREHWRMNPFT